MTSPALRAPRFRALCGLLLIMLGVAPALAGELLLSS
jgi:hypothetical protein